MATRRDFVMIAEVLRTTGMDTNTRGRLAHMFSRVLAEQVPRFEADKFIHEATRGTRSNDEQPTLTFPSVLFTPHKLREDWKNLDLTEAEQEALRGAPVAALASGLIEALGGQQEAVTALEDEVYEAATDAVLRKAEKFRQRSA